MGLDQDSLHSAVPMPAQAIDAEHSVLGAMLNSDKALELGRFLLTGQEFFQDRHQVIFEALGAIADAGVKPDSIVLGDYLRKRGQLEKAGGSVYLFELFQDYLGVANLGYHADIIRRAYKHRQMTEVAVRLQQMLTSSAGTLDVHLDAVARASVKLDELLDDVTSSQAIDGLSDWEEFLVQANDARKWIVEDLFEEQDVWMILAPGGSGKSWLSRQLCLSIAAGIHPFIPSLPIVPQNTLLIDLEVSDSMLRAQTQPVFEQVMSLGESVAGRGFVWRKQEGLNLRDRADAKLLERVVAETEPKFVAIGSLYKAYQKGNSDWDTAAEETRAVFDRIRKRYGVCWWIEHHMNRAPGGGISGTPYGGSTWDKWPTHGRTLSAIKELKEPVFSFGATWRGDRDPRKTPPALRRTTRLLPWAPVDQDQLDGYLQGAGIRLP